MAAEIIGYNASYPSQTFGTLARPIPLLGAGPPLTLAIFGLPIQQAADFVQLDVTVTVSGLLAANINFNIIRDTAVIFSTQETVIAGVAETISFTAIDTLLLPGHHVYTLTATSTVLAAAQVSGPVSFSGAAYIT